MLKCSCINKHSLQAFNKPSSMVGMVYFDLAASCLGKQLLLLSVDKLLPKRLSCSNFSESIKGIDACTFFVLNGNYIYDCVPRRTLFPISKTHKCVKLWDICAFLIFETVFDHLIDSLHTIAFSWVHCHKSSFHLTPKCACIDNHITTWTVNNLSSWTF